MLKHYFDKTLEFSKKIYYNNLHTNASMAQLVEQRIRNAQVVGSSPTTSSREHLHKQVLFLYIHLSYEKATKAEMSLSLMIFIY